MAAVVSIILKALVEWWCYSIAEKQGRNAGLAAVLGFFFGLFAVIGYYIAGDKNPEDSKSEDANTAVEEAEVVESNEVVEEAK